MIFKDNQDVRILSRMTINKKVFIKNKSLLPLDLNNENQIANMLQDTFRDFIILILSENNSYTVDD